MPFRSTLELRYAGVGRYEVTAPLLYEGATDWIAVEPGFQTDLASVPRIVRWLLPQDGKWTRSSVFHDWACRRAIHEGVLTSRDADGLYRRQCREDGVPLLARWLLWCGVRWSALTEPHRRPGWLRDAPAVFALSLLAAPLVASASLVVGAALAVYAVVEAVVSLFDPTAGGAA